MIREKIKLFFAKFQKLIILLALIICLCSIVFINYKFNLIKKIGELSSDKIAVLGTLLGAIIGGIFTLLGSVYVNQKQLKAQTYIKKKNLIYKPLYDELCDIENLLKENPYPRKIVFTNDYGFKYPEYTAWQRIKSDTRYLETPNTLKVEMNNLYTIIESYNKNMEQIGKICTDIFNKVLEEKIGTTCTIGNIGDILYKNVLNEVNDSLFFDYKDSLKNTVDLSESVKQEIDNDFYAKCQENDMIKNLKITKTNWKNQQQKCIELLKYMIMFVNIKYEG